MNITTTYKNDICPDCNGHGRIQKDKNDYQVDPKTGLTYPIYNVCNKCDGSGLITIKTTTEILPFRK